MPEWSELEEDASRQTRKWADRFINHPIRTIVLLVVIFVVIGAIFLQVRDTVGACVHQQLSHQIGEGFQRLFDDALDKKVRDLLDEEAGR